MEKITELIRNDFQVRRQRHPSFSLRAYARFLGVSLTSLSMSMNNQRKLSQRTKIKILSKIGVDPESLIYEGDEKLEFQHLDLEKLNIVSDWYYFAILSLWETKDYVDKPSWISERLGIDLESADNALKTLKKYRFFTKRGQQFMTPDGIQAYAIRKSHIQALDLARHSLENDEVSKRHFSAMTVATSPEKIEEAGKRIQKFRRRLTRFLESGEKTEVYRLSVQLYPLSRGKR